MAADMPPKVRIGIGIVFLILAIGLGVAAFLVGGLFIPGAIAAGIPLAALGGSVLFGQDRDGDKGVVGPVTLYVLAGAVTLGTVCGVFAGAHATLGPGATVAALLALAARRGKKKLDLSRVHDPRDRNL
ncbi:MAG TPA: hypothetical protein VF651_10145 [Gammaproteobacteria bacterium]